MRSVQAQKHMMKAEEMLRKAQVYLQLEHAETAGRQSYMAALHAVIAFIVQRTGKEPKSHNGARSEFARLAQQESVFDRSYTTFLAEAYKLKSVADYGVELTDVISLEEAHEAVAFAQKFVSLIDKLIKTDPVKTGEQEQ